MGRRTAWVTEEWDVDAPLEMVRVGGGQVGDEWYLGTFTCNVETQAGEPELEPAEGLSLDAAIAWARERADEIVIRVGDENYGFGAPDLPEPPPDLAARAVRRRPEGERWKDRTPGDEPIAWTVEAAVMPVWTEGPNRFVEDAARLEEEAQALIAALAPSRWSAEPVEEFRAQFAEIQRSGPKGEETGWFSWGEPRWLLWFAVDAPTREQAIAQVKARTALPDGWELCARAEPADAGT